MANLIARRPATLETPPLPERSLALLHTRWLDARAWWGVRSAEVARRPVSERMRGLRFEPELEDEPGLASLEWVLHQLAAERAARAAGEAPAAGSAAPGRLLISAFDLLPGQGHAEVQSEGFFDSEDRPPWDGWLLAFGRSRPGRPDDPIFELIAWVPEELTGLADAGIRALAERHLRWLDEAPGPLADQIARRLRTE